MKLLPSIVCGTFVVGALLLAPTVSADQQLAASMCDYVAADDRNRFRKVLSDYRLRLRNIYDGVICNGDSLVRHAFRSEANDVGEFIIRQLPGSQLVDSGDVEWAEANGFGATELFSSLQDRAGS